MQIDADLCIYHKWFIKDDEECILIIAVYVDDFLIALNSTHAFQLEKKRLGEHLEMEDECEVHYILGICVMRNQKEGLLTIYQHAFLLSVLKRFGMETMPEVKFEKLNDDEVVVKLKEYQYVIGSLTYASIEMRPNI